VLEAAGLTEEAPLARAFRQEMDGGPLEEPATLQTRNYGPRSGSLPARWDTGSVAGDCAGRGCGILITRKADAPGVSRLFDSIRCLAGRWQIVHGFGHLPPG